MQWNPDHLDLRRVVLPLIATGSDLYIEAVGTVFIIHYEGDTALAMTAAHVIDHIYRNIEQPYPTWQDTAPREFRRQVDDFELKDTKMRVLYPDDDGNIQVLEAGLAHVLRGSDIALCIIKAPHRLSGQIRFYKKLAIDSSPPSVGTVISAIGYSRLEDSDPIKEGTMARVTHSETLSERTGRITDVFPNGAGGNHPFPCFQTTIPFAHGMSGGPVLANAGEHAVAIGIISSDLMGGERSMASILWPAMGIQLKRDFLEGVQGPTLLDMQKRNLVIDKGKAHEHVVLTPQTDSSDPTMAWHP